MVTVNNEDLVKRIARLARQNQELEDQIKKLLKQNEKLSKDYERIKALYEKVSPAAVKGTGDAEKKEESLKFNMATVLFSEIHGFSGLGADLDSSAVMDLSLIHISEPTRPY